MYEILQEFFFEICMFQIISRRYGFKIHVTLSSRLWVWFFQQRKSYVKEKEKRKNILTFCGDTLEKKEVKNCLIICMRQK